MTTNQISISLDEDTYWQLREVAASERMDEDEYVRQLLLEDLGVDPGDDEEPPDTFGEFLVQELDVSGSRRRENVRGVGQALYETWDPEASDGDAPPWDLWNEALKTRAEAAAEERPDVDPDTYRSSVRGSVYDAGFDGHEQFRQRVGTLVREYDERTES